MTKTISVWLLAIFFVANVSIAQAQQAPRVPRIGFLGATTLATIPARIDAFRQGLRDLGYVEGKSIVVDYRWAEGKMERLPDLANELLRLKVDVIVTSSPTVTRAAKEATVLQVKLSEEKYQTNKFYV